MPFARYSHSSTTTRKSNASLTPAVRSSPCLKTSRIAWALATIWTSYSICCQLTEQSTPHWVSRETSLLLLAVSLSTCKSTSSDHPPTKFSSVARSMYSRKALCETSRMQNKPSSSMTPTQAALLHCQPCLTVSLAEKMMKMSWVFVNRGAHRDRSDSDA